MADQWILPRIGTNETPLRIAILISGSGSGMEALLKHQQQQGCLHESVVVISDKQQAGGLMKAQALGVPSIVIPLPEIDDRIERRLVHEEEIHETLIAHDIELVVLSGYMRIVTPSFVSKWAGRILNIHPSLLPDFPGAHAHRDVIAAGVKRSGCTVHFVDSEMDSGPIIAQREVEVLESDNEESLAERVKIEEHQIYPSVIDDLAAGRIQLP